MKRDDWRQMDFYTASEDRNTILIVGCGHVGAPLAIGLAYLGVKRITICDMDYVEAHNLPSQFFSMKLMENVTDEQKMLKVVALQQTIGMLVPDCKIEIIPTEIQALQGKSFDVIFSCVDDMKAREYIYNQYKDTGALIIDPRTGGEFFNVLAIDLNNDDARKFYQKTLYSNEEASPLPCTGTAVADVSLACAAECIQRYRSWYKKQLRVMYSSHDMHIGASAGIMQGYDIIQRNEKVRNQILFDDLGKQPVYDNYGEPVNNVAIAHDQEIDYNGFLDNEEWNNEDHTEQENVDHYEDTREDR